MVGVDDGRGRDLVSAVKRAEAPDEREGGSTRGDWSCGCIIPRGREREARIRLRGGIARAWRTNILEAPGEALTVGADGVRLPAPGKSSPSPSAPVAASSTLPLEPA